MVQNHLSRRLSAQDAAFLYFEKKEAPFHIGSIGVFEGEISYERFVEHVGSKLHLIPRYLQRVVPAPFNVGYPTWEVDPDFDIRRHIHRVRIEPPGTDAQLMELAPRLFAGMLDRGKPLWEIYLVEGLEGSRTAMVSKVHHCLVDGVSGIALLMVTLDISPNPPPVQPPEEPHDPPPMPDPARRLSDAIWDNLQEGVDRWTGLQRGLLKMALGRDDRRARHVLEALRTALPYFALPVSRAPFNKAFSGDRRLSCSDYSFAEVRAIRQAVGGTVNDVVLAVLGGAMSRYLDMRRERTGGRSLRVLVPVSVRREEERGALGNRISMILVEVPMDVRDPLERLRVISERMASLKDRRVADGMELLADSLGALPPSVQAFIGSAPWPPNTVANMVCTNVPGPMIPLYAVGHRMLAHFPLIPLGWEMGICCGVTSYNQKLYFGLMADAGTATDLDELKAFLDESYLELREAAGVGKLEILDLGLSEPLTPSQDGAAPASPTPSEERVKAD